jgi:hypothetical protein
MPKHLIVVAEKPPSQILYPSRRREGHVADGVREVVVEVVAVAVVVAGLQILPEVLHRETSFNLLYVVVAEEVVAASRRPATHASKPSITARRI